MHVTDRVAIVTGGGRGIGRGIALVLARNGADLVVADLDVKNAANVAAEVEGLGRRSMAASLDVTQQASTEHLVEETLAHFGRIDILVNNAGVVAAPGWEQRERNNEDDWDLVYEVNVKGVAHMIESVSPSMKERAYGKIINIASVAGRQGTPDMPAYSASKAAVINLTQSTALELAPFDINVNAICPGLLWTPMWERIARHRSTLPENREGLSPKELYEDHVKQRTPLGREQTPEDIGNLAAFLASDFACNITGQAINVSGGIFLS